MKFTIIKSGLAPFSGIFALGTPSNIHGTAISYRCAKFGAFVNSVTILTLRDLTKTLVSVYIQRKPALRPPRLYDHLLPQLTSHGLSTQTWKSPSHFFILKTSWRRPPRYYDLDFMAQCWSHQRGSTVFFNFSFPHCRTKNKKKNVRQLDYGN